MPYTHRQRQSRSVPSALIQAAPGFVRPKPLPELALCRDGYNDLSHSCQLIQPTAVWGRGLWMGCANSAVPVNRWRRCPSCCVVGGSRRAPQTLCVALKNYGTQFARSRVESSCRGLEGRNAVGGNCTEHRFHRASLFDRRYVLYATTSVGQAT